MVRELAKENELIAELVVAKELGKTLGELRALMTFEEVFLWCAFFRYQNEEQEKAMKKARRR